MNNSNYIVCDSKGTISDPRLSIFPILKELDNNHWQLIGTAFFIRKEGFFVTAKHVLVDCLAEKNKKYQQVIPIKAFFIQGQTYYERAIEHAVFFENTDVAVGKLAPPDGFNTGVFYNPYLGICDVNITIGQEVYTYAYPKTNCSPGRIHVNASYYAGSVAQYFREQRESSMLNFPCFETNIDILGGASGGPVINGETGSVFGINCSSIDGCSPPVSYVTDIRGVDFCTAIKQLSNGF